jgi:hypothetical protein
MKVAILSREPDNYSSRRGSRASRTGASRSAATTW